MTLQPKNPSQINPEVGSEPATPFQPQITIPTHYILISADAKKYEPEPYELNRLSNFVKISELEPQAKDILTGSRYEMAPAGTCELTIRFYQNGQRVKPKGKLRLQPKRGKVSLTRYELDGTQDEIVAKFTAPDETIRISIRAFLNGFYRGKIHFYLEDDGNS